MSCLDDTSVRGWLLLALFLSLIAVIVVPVKLSKRKKSPKQPPPAGPSCFVLNHEPHSWHSHHRIAHDQGCNLAAIRYPIENDILLLLIETNDHIRSYDDKNDSDPHAIWLGGELHGVPGQRGAANWKWTDERSQWTYENWGMDEPNNFPEEFSTAKETVENRITIRNIHGQRAWNDLRQKEEIPALYKCCGSTAATSRATPRTTSLRSCSFELNPRHANWNVHHDMALAKSCDLASILNKHENYRALKLITSSDLSHVDSIWLGGQLTGTPASKGPLHWQWSDGSEYSYENWLKGEPNDFWLSYEDRLSMRYYADRDVWEWNDVLATVELPAFYNCCQE